MYYGIHRKKENEEGTKVLYNFYYKGVNYMEQFLGSDTAAEQEIHKRFPDVTKIEKEEILKILKMHIIVYPAEATHIWDLVRHMPGSIITPGQSASAAFRFITGVGSASSKPLPPEGKGKDPESPTKIQIMKISQAKEDQAEEVQAEEDWVDQEDQEDQAVQVGHT